MDFVRALGATKELSPSLDGKFWVWETIEEPIRGEVDNMQVDEIDAAWVAFCVHHKGSREMFDNLETRAFRDYSELFPAKKEAPQHKHETAHKYDQDHHKHDEHHKHADHHKKH